MLLQLGDLLVHSLRDRIALFDAVKMYLDLVHEIGPFQRWNEPPFLRFHDRAVLLWKRR
jgi:hypothetical protein